MNGSEFLDTPDADGPGPVASVGTTGTLEKGPASAFLDAPESTSAAGAPAAPVPASAFLDAPAAPVEPSAEEIAAASKPARMTLTRGGQPVLQSGTPAAPLERAVAELGAAVAEQRDRSVRRWAEFDAGVPVSAEEHEMASRPARMTLTRGGQPVLQPNAPAPEEPPEKPSASWGEVVESLPAQFVAGGRSAAANLRRMSAEESVTQNEAILRRMEAGEGMDGRPEGERPVRMTLTRGGQAVLDTGAPAERQAALLAAERAELSKAIAEAAQARSDVRLVTPKDQTVAQEALSSLAQSSGPTLLGLAAGILTRNVPLAMTIAGGGGAAQQAGATYGEARDEHGATHRQASLAALIDGALEGGGEMLPLGFALKPGTPIFKRIFGTMAREAGQEAVTQFAQDLRAMAMENPKLTLGEVWRHVKVAALAGAGGGAVYGGAGAAVNAAREREAKLASDFLDREQAPPGAQREVAPDPAPSSSPAPAPAAPAGPGVESRSDGEDVPRPQGVDQDPPRQAAPEARDRDVHAPGALPDHPLVEPAKTGELKSGFEKIDDAGKAAHALASLRRSPQERIYILALDAEDRPLSVLRLFAGGMSDVSVHPEVVAKAVYQTPDVAKVWIAHNHPSGVAVPSVPDQHITAKLAKLFGEGTGVDVAGHVVIAGTKYALIDAAGTPQGAASIPPAARTHTIPITERVVRKPALGNLETIRDTGVAREAVPRAAAGRAGVAFLDAQNQLLGFMPMNIEEMRRLRSASERGGNSAARRFFDAAGRVNASGLILYSPEGVLRQAFEAGARNVAAAAELGGLRALDAIHGTVSLSAINVFPFGATGQVPTTFEARAMPAEAVPATEFQAQAPEAQGGAQAAGGPVPPSVPPRASREGSSEEGERPAGGITLTPPYTPAGEQRADGDAKRARPDAIRQAIRDLLGVPINEGRFGGSRDKVGIYKVKPRTIRVRNRNDIGVIAHETGHHFSETSRPVRALVREHERELRTITPYAASQKTALLQREEGFAEYLRFAWTQPERARAAAPGFSAAFESYVDKSGYRPAFKAIEGAIRDWQNLPPVDRILAKVGEEEPEIGKRWNLDRIVFEVFDNWLPLKRMVADLKPDIAPASDPFKLAHLLSGDAAVIEDWLLRETVPFNFSRRANLKDRGKPLAEILKPIEGQHREFSAYLIAKRANELMGRDKEHLYSRDEIAAGLALETPELRRAAEALYEYQDQLLDYAVEGGLLSAGAARAFRRHAFYVPFFRVGERIGQRGDVFKEIRGGTENLRDPIGNVIENTVRLIHATNRNFVLAKAHELAHTVPGGGRWLEDVPMPERAVKLQAEKVIETLREQGLEIDPEAAEALATSMTFFVQNPFGDDRDRIIIVRRQGKPYALQVNDDMLWHALERFEPVDMGLIEKVLSVPADILRAGIVLSPDFMARNFARDTLSGFMQSKKGLIPVAGTLDGFKEVATRSDAARLYRAFGGAFGDMWRADRGFERKPVERMARRGGFDPRTILTPRGLISLLHRIGSVTEAGTRVAEFKRTAEEGDINSLIDAAYNAREVSVDFGMHGHSRSLRFLTRVTVFMNPALQGYYKAARTGKGQPFTTLLRGSLLAAASVGLFLKNRDEEWYEDIEQWERNVYWHMDVGLRDPQGQVIPLRIPKPFEWGGVFGSIPEALAQVSIEQHGKKFAKRLASIVDDVFTFRVIPSALVVPAELWANKNQFTGRPIVPESKERLAPELQTTPGSSLTARKAGELTDTSPAKIDHAIRGLFGTLGTYTTMLADEALVLAGEGRDKLPLPWPRMPVARAFFRDPSGSNSRYVNEFYDLLKEARRAEASLKHLPAERMAEYEAKHREALEQRRGAEKVSKWMAELRRENEGLRRDRDLPAEERVRMIAENNAQIRWLAKGARARARGCAGR